MMPDLARFTPVLAQQPYPLACVTLCGDPLYGIAAPDSDYELRGIHVLPAPEVLGLYPRRETVELQTAIERVPTSLVTHDVHKAIGWMLRPNGHVLEQIMSPLVIHTSPAHDALRAFVPRCVTRGHVHHYLGFARNGWEVLNQQTPWRVRPLLHVFRILLTGIHLMKTGQIEANLSRLNDSFKLASLPDLIACLGDGEATLSDADAPFHQAEVERLLALLEHEGERSALPEGATCAPEMNTLLLRLRGLRM